MIKACVIGWPIAHSRSPAIHRFWLQRYGIAGDYEAKAVPPEAIDDFLGAFGSSGYVGGNVTVPHKEAAFRACRKVTPVAARLGAVNTLWLEAGGLFGDNSDAYGFAANLAEQAPAWRPGGSALVIGAGGAARSVVAALVEAGYNEIAVANRTPERAAALARHFGAPIRAYGLDAVPKLLPSASLIVNTTAAGMQGHDALSMDWRAARRDAIATDIVYIPLITPFLAGAKARGLTIVDGLGMLLHQAAPGFERWFGRRPDVDGALRAHVVADLGG